MARPSPVVFAVAPDKQAAAFVGAAMIRLGLAPEIARTASSAAALAPKIRAAGRRAVLAVLDQRIATTASAAVAACHDNGGLALWVDDPSAGAASDRVGWLSGQLLAQRGGLRCPELSTLIEVIRLHAFLGPAAAPGLRPAAPRGGVAARLDALAARLGVLVASRGGTATQGIEISAQGDASLRATSARLALPDPEASLRAFALLARRGRRDDPGPTADAAVDNDVVELIAKPPARTLSEVASKRLVAAYGIGLPDEKLCASPTESARYADGLDGPVVLKLVRPGTPCKSRADAVRIGVSGAARVRRAHHELVRCGKELGPPEPLGVLVSPEIAGGARIWIARERDADLGLLVVGGGGDAPSASPGFALAAPASIAEARRALDGAGLPARPAQLDALAEAIRRFSRLVADLGDRVDLAEIHPLVATDDRPALALDALISVAG